MKKYIKAFTLIELLIVIAIIGVLLALSVFGLKGSREAARDAKRKADLEAIRSGLEIYKSDCNTYPTAPWTPSSASLVGPAGSPVSCVGNIYISAPIKDPIDPTATYSYVSNGTTYTLCSHLEQPPTSPDVTNCGSCTIATGCKYKVINP